MPTFPTLRFPDSFLKPNIEGHLIRKERREQLKVRKVGMPPLFRQFERPGEFISPLRFA